MRRLPTAFAACVLALCGVANAAERENWFNGGIGEDWPASASMSGGAWCDKAEERGRMVGGVLQISADEDETLAFEATYSKSLGDDKAAKNAIVVFSCAFQPFPDSALPEVPDDAKGAIILVTDDDPEEAEKGTLYYAAYDGKKNVWKSSGVEAKTNEFVSFSMQCAPISDSFISVKYDIKGSTYSVSIRQSNQVARGVYYAGAGRTDNLYSAYEPGSGNTLNVMPVTGLVVTNVTANGESIGSGYGAYSVEDGSYVVVYYAAALGYKMNGSGIVPIGVVTQDTTVDENTPGIPEVEALGKYQIGITTYASFEAMNAALKDGDVVEMLADDTLPVGAMLSKRVTFVIGKYVLSTASGEILTIAADVTFTAKAAKNLPLTFYILIDRLLTLPAGTAFDDYLLSGEDYAHVAIGDERWVRYNGRWMKADRVTMQFYYPGYFERTALAMGGPLGGLIESDRLDAFVNFIRTEDCAQQFYYDQDTEVLIDYVYWFDGTWSSQAGSGDPVELPTRYVAGDFYPNSTAIAFRITYDMGVATEATNPNPSSYTIETDPFLLEAASASGYTFRGWKDRSGNEVTDIDPLVLGAESGRLYDIALYADWVESAVNLTANQSAQLETYAVTYDLASVPGATNAVGNITEYDEGLVSFVLLPAGAKGYDFVRWTDAKGAAVTVITGSMRSDIALCAAFALTPVKPGEPTAYDTPEQAVAAAAAFNADKTKAIVVPEGFTGDRASYAAHFEAVAEGSSVTVVLTEMAKEKIAERLGGDMISVAASLANPAVKTVTIRDAEPGFYYSVVGGTTESGVTEEGDGKLAQEPTVELQKPDLGETDKAFYRVKADWEKTAVR